VIRIDFDPDLAAGLANSDEPGEALADRLRELAYWVEHNINILPAGSPEWVTERHEVGGMTLVLSKGATT
jgi:hypothetical protein